MDFTKPSCRCRPPPIKIAGYNYEIGLRRFRFLAGESTKVDFVDVAGNFSWRRGVFEWTSQKLHADVIHWRFQSAASGKGKKSALIACGFHRLCRWATVERLHSIIFIEKPDH